MNEQRFYEKDWLSVKGWKRQGGIYKKKTPGIEAKMSLAWLKESCPKGRLLDMGCGGGRNSVLFSRAGYEVWGIDFSKTAINLANQLARENRLKIKFVQSNALQSGLKSDYFDIVADFGMFHHLRKHEWKAYKKELKRLLKDRGFYVLYCFSTKSESTEKWNPHGKRRWFARKGHYTRFFSEEEIKAIFHDFKVLKSKLISEKGRRLKFNLVLMQRL